MSILPKLNIMALIWMVLVAPVFAHQDTVLKLEDGKLTGLPKDYAPAAFDKDKKRLRIANREVVFSEYVASLFPDDGDYELKISASWYHDMGFEGALPPYIYFQIKKKDWTFQYNILINMKTLELIEVEVQVKESERSGRHLTIDLDAYGKEITKWEPYDIKKG